MEKMKKSTVISILLSNGNREDLAEQYADAYQEYREATENIEDNGLICASPRTGSPIENPYLVIRDRALKKLQNMRMIKTKGLW